MPQSYDSHECFKCGTVKERQEMVLNAEDNTHCVRCILAITGMGMVPTTHCADCGVGVANYNLLSTRANLERTCWECYSEHAGRAYGVTDDNEYDDDDYECEGCYECSSPDDEFTDVDGNRVEFDPDPRWTCQTCHTVALQFDIESEEFVCDHLAAAIKLRGGVINDDPIMVEIMLGAAQQVQAAA